MIVDTAEKSVIGVWMLLLLGLVAVGWLFAGCMTSLMSQTPVTRTLTLHESPDAAYQRASHALARMGATITQANTQTRLLSGQVHGAVVLNVSVTGSAQASTVEVTGSLIPGKLAVGSFTEVDAYMALLQ